MKKMMILSCVLIAVIAMGVMERKTEKEQVVSTSQMEEELPRDGLGRDRGIPEIRVLIKSDDYQSEYHERICMYSQAGCKVQCGTETFSYGPGERIEYDGKPEGMEEGAPVVVTPLDDALVLPELVRGYEEPTYPGTMEIYPVEQGYLLVNVLPLETYLCAVVPSEMPASYPMEALKAQAVCARTYAVKAMEGDRAAEFHADVDDSTSFQVYNNQPTARETDQAVAETKGMVLTEQGECIDALYYSTSCGLDLHLDLSQEAVFAAFLSEDHLQAYEAEEPLFRWQTEILLDHLDQVSGLEVLERSEKGAVVKMGIQKKSLSQEAGEETETQEVLEGEYQIRKFLAQADPEVTLQDGTVWQNRQLLPSAFFIMTPLYREGTVAGYLLNGGGYGHGEGMSQNGAKHMAQKGMNFREILACYYEEAELEELEEPG